jgi:hypothetical protein
METVVDPMSPLPAHPDKTAAAVKEIVETPKKIKKEIKLDQALLMSEVQLLLAEKRTSFALLRTGVSVSLVPLSMWTVLVATSKLYDPFSVLWLLIPIMAIAIALFTLGIYLVVHAFQHIRHADLTLHALRQSDTLLEDLLYAH